MSDTARVAFVQQFTDEVRLLHQQKGTMLRSTVFEKEMNGKARHFERLGNAEATLITSQNQKITPGDIEHSRRQVTLLDYGQALYIDKLDDIRMLIDRRAPYASQIAYALGRKMDANILASLTGNASTVDGDDGISSVALGASQTLDDDEGGTDSDLNVDKLLAAKELFTRNHKMIDDKTLVMNASAERALLGIDKATSSDYNTIRTLVNGAIDTFVGFKFITLGDGLLRGTADGTDTDPVQVVAYVKNALGLGIGKEITIEVKDQPDHFSTDSIIGVATFGSVRVEEEGVVLIPCVQSS